jgi:hypothetical protein
MIRVSSITKNVRHAHVKEYKAISEQVSFKALILLVSSERKPTLQQAILNCTEILILCVKLKLNTQKAF